MFEGNQQIRVLIEQGLTPEEAAESLGLDTTAVKMALASRTKVNSLAELVEQFKPEAYKLLMDIGRYSENDSARVAALKICINGEGVMPDVSASQLTKRLENMKRVHEQREIKTIELSPV